MGRGNSLIVRSGAIWFLLAALLFRAAIPAGWMPSSDGTLVICTLKGAQAVVLGADGKPQPVPDNEPAPSALNHGLCHFAGNHHAPPPAPVSLNAPLALILAHVPSAEALFGGTNHLRLADARGPPPHA